ncbi:pinopsin-like [Hoplias malabaricus]|uniref:pinopsin-like n=1 Tax=Hoplias malabaricus TaxID=27720 RepID=UPI0034631F8C
MVPEVVLTWSGHSVLAMYLGLCSVVGFVSNLVVLVLFARFSVLRTPVTCLLLNVSVSDMLLCVLGTPFIFSSSVFGRWLIGPRGCGWFGFANTLSGVVSLVSLTVLSVERYCWVVCGSGAEFLDLRKVRVSAMFCWCYSLVWMVPPLLGRSRYGPEGPGTTCSIQWNLQNPGSRTYIICLFIFCLLLPLLIILFCYGSILLSVHTLFSALQNPSLRRREVRVLLIVLLMVLWFLFCWLPYGTVALLGTLGSSVTFGPFLSIFPAVLSMSSTVINPVLYVLFNRQFYRCFLALVKCGSQPQPKHRTHTLYTPHTHSTLHTHSTGPHSVTDISEPNGIALGVYTHPTPSGVKE